MKEQPAIRRAAGNTTHHRKAARRREAGTLRFAEGPRRFLPWWERRIEWLIERHATRAPQSPALYWEGGAMSYGELNAAANRLARFLMKSGVEQENRVAVLMPRGPALVTALLAILKAGAAYVPVDPAYPEARIAFMLADAAPSLILVSSRNTARGLASVAQAITLDVDALSPMLAQETTENPPLKGRDGHGLACVIYTSGSTGTPKGVLVEQQSVCNRLLWGRADMPVGPADVLLTTAPLGFDAATGQIFGALTAGAALILPPAGAERDIGYLAALIRRHDGSILPLPPALVPLALDWGAFADTPSLRLVLSSGESLSGYYMRRLQTELDVTVRTNYGPTEATISSASFTGMDVPLASAVPIGRPIWNTHIYVLGPDGAPARAGETGDIYIGGLGIARGYHNRPGLTAERFVPDQVGNTGGRLYRTGDLGRWREDGLLEFLGREDAQVKLHGFRIELGEIESTLAAVPGVRAAAVRLWADSPEEKRLVAYIVPRQADEAPAIPERLRAHLRSQLPVHMIPARFVLLDALPLTANGKLDRAALPASPADSEMQSEAGHGAFLNAKEEAIAAVWSELLKLEAMDRDAHFFDLGGDSLLALQAMLRLKEVCATELSISLIYEYPHLCSLAAKLPDFAS